MIALVLIEILIFGGLLAADLVSKHFVMPYLEAHGDLVLIDKVLTLTPAYNEGAGFSMLSGKTGLLIAVTVVGLAIILGVSVYAHAKLNTRSPRVRYLLVVLCMLLAGGVGNLVDRIMYGSVRDFIDYTLVQTLFHRSFAICNVADVWLTVGMILLLVYVIFLMKESDKRGAAPLDMAADKQVVADALRLMDAHKPSRVDERQVIMKEDSQIAPIDTGSQAKTAVDNVKASDEVNGIGQTSDIDAPTDDSEA